MDEVDSTLVLYQCTLRIQGEYQVDKNQQEYNIGLLYACNYHLDLSQLDSHIQLVIYLKVTIICGY